MARRGNSVVTEWVRACAGAALAAALAACPEPTAAAPDAGAALVKVVPAADGGWGLTASQLDAWLAFQKARFAALADAGALSVEARAQLEGRLVREAGLDFETVDRVEEIAGAVVTARLVERLTGEDAAKELERVASGLSGEQKAQVQEAAASLREKLAAAEPLAAERAAYGEDAVKLVLARETQVEATWNALLELKGPEARAPRPRAVGVDGGVAGTPTSDGGVDGGRAADGGAAAARPPDGGEGGAGGASADGTSAGRAPAANTSADTSAGGTSAGGTADGGRSSSAR